MGLHYYEFHVKDYMADTPDLSLLEHGAYRRLIDLCYLRGGPLPDDMAGIYRAIGASSPTEKNTAKAILHRFFTHDEGGWMQKKCARVIANGGKLKDTRSRAESGSKGGKQRAANAQAKLLDESQAKYKQNPSNEDGEKQPSIIHNPLSIIHHPGNGAAGEPDLAEKNAAEAWLHIESAAFLAALNSALGRGANHPPSADEGAAITAFAAHQQPPDHIALADLRALGAYLSAAPRYDNTAATQAWEALPPDSLLRQRRRRSDRVLADLANHIVLAWKWAEAAKKKEKRRLPVNFYEMPPCVDWKKIAAGLAEFAALSSDEMAALNWAEAPGPGKRAVWLAFCGEGGGQP